MQVEGVEVTIKHRVALIIYTAITKDWSYYQCLNFLENKEIGNRISLENIECPAMFNPRVDDYISLT